jgi:glycolate oxidase FAD binding subunit
VTVRTADPHRCVQAALHGRFVPTAIELDREAAGDATVAVLLEGTAGGVRERTAQALAALGPDARAVEEPAWWGRLPDGEVLLRLTCAPGGLGRLLAAAAELGLAVRGSAGVGSLWAATAADPGRVRGLVDGLRAGAAAWQGTVQVLRAPAAVRDAVDAWGPVPGLELMRRVKDGFDPGRRLAPGRFVGGI